MYKHILVPTDGSDITHKAVQAAIGLARLSGAKLSTPWGKEPFPYIASSAMQPRPPQGFYAPQASLARGRKLCYVFLSALEQICRNRSSSLFQPRGTMKPLSGAAIATTYPQLPTTSHLTG